MPDKKFEQQTAYPTDLSELTGLEDERVYQSEKNQGLWGKLVRLVAGDPPEEHDKGRALRRAVRAQEIDKVRDMIRKGVGVNEAQEASLACIACRRTNIDMLKLLVDAGVDINKPDKRSQNSKSRSPLQEASRKGWLEGVQLLINLGAEIDFCEKGDVTSLHIASRMGHVEVVKLLLMNRADPCGSKFSITSPLHETSSPRILNMLISAGGSVSLRDRNKCTPLHLQTYSGRYENVSILLEANADLHAFDRKGRPAIFLLGGRGDVIKTYRVLKDAGIDYSIRDLNENTLAHSIAHRACSDEILDIIFEDAPHLWEMKNLSGQTPIDILIAREQMEWAQKFQDKIDRLNIDKCSIIGDDVDMLIKSAK